MVAAVCASFWVKSGSRAMWAFLSSFYPFFSAVFSFSFFFKTLLQTLHLMNRAIADRFGETSRPYPKHLFHPSRQQMPHGVDVVTAPAVGGRAKTAEAAVAVRVVVVAVVMAAATVVAVAVGETVAGALHPSIPLPVPPRRWPWQGNLKQRRHAEAGMGPNIRQHARKTEWPQPPNWVSWTWSPRDARERFPRRLSGKLDLQMASQAHDHKMTS
jgi:hypothetical protein